MANEKELMKVRNEKLQKIEQYGIHPHPERYETTHEIGRSRELEDGTKNISIAGRIMSKRKMGKISFLDLSDITGHIQLVIKRDNLGEEEYKKFHEITDIGDFMGVTGEVFTTEAGEKSLQVSTYKFLGKALRPLPEKYHGLVNQEAIYRERHLDLIMNEEAKKKFLLRSKFVRLLREFLDNNGFIEVETPALQNTASGATAKPFIAHHNAHDMDVYLRISPELTLKKLIIGGFNNIYEVARDFRNEGISANHLQDFTMVEGYSAYWNYEDNMKFMKKMITYILEKLYDGNLNIKIGDKIIDFGGEWKVVSFRDLVLKDCGIDIDKFETAKDLLQEIRSKKIELEAENIEDLGRGNLIDQLYKKVSRPSIIEPTFLIKHPIDLSPLARSNDQNSLLTDRFQLIVNGQEIINGYSELVDSKEQEARLLKQSELKAQGDEEAMSIDYEYIRAMEYGMPPISGWGLGVDRFLQFLTSSQNIRDVVLYPLMKPINKVEENKSIETKKTEKSIDTSKGISREKALEILKKYNKEEFHIRHALTVEGVMRYFAKENGQDIEYWGNIGLLHDVDFEIYPEEHCKKCIELLKENDVNEQIINSICSHAYGICSDIKPEHIMEKILFATDELTGLIWATAKMRPSKSVQDLEVSSLKKKFKDKKFAAGCSRDTIKQGAEMLGWELDQLFEKTILAMRENEREINEYMQENTSI